MTGVLMQLECLHDELTGHGQRRASTVLTGAGTVQTGRFSVAMLSQTTMRRCASTK
jgi:hypothetical protein